MLGKLFKYEMKAVGRWFLPIYALVLILAVWERISIEINNRAAALGGNILSGAITFAFVIVLIGFGIGSGILLIYRFYKNMVTNEGYLMHTLPVTTHHLIWSKAIVAVIWSLASVIVFCLAISALLVGGEGWNYVFMVALPEVSNEMMEYGLFVQYPVLILEIILLAIVSSFSQILMVYAAISLGQLVAKHKILGAFGAYVLLNMAVQFAQSLHLLPSATSSLFSPINAEEAVDATESIVSFVNATITSILPAMILRSLILIGIFYFITYYIFKNFLNLE